MDDQYAGVSGLLRNVIESYPPIIDFPLIETLPIPNPAEVKYFNALESHPSIQPKDIESMAHIDRYSRRKLYGDFFDSHGGLGRAHA